MPPCPNHDDLDRRLFVLLEEPSPADVGLVLVLGLCLGMILGAGLTWCVFALMR